MMHAPLFFKIQWSLAFSMAKSLHWIMTWWNARGVLISACCMQNCNSKKTEYQTLTFIVYDIFIFSFCPTCISSFVLFYFGPWNSFNSVKGTVSDEKNLKITLEIKENTGKMTFYRISFRRHWVLCFSIGKLP